MINKELLEYVEKRLSEKVTKEDLITELSSGGWSKDDVSDVLEKITKTENSDKVSQGITGGINLIFLFFVLLYLSMFTTDIVTSGDYGLFEKIAIGIVWIILLPLLLILKIKSRKKEKDLAPSVISEHIIKKIPNTAKRILHSIYIFGGLWILWAFLQFAFLNDGS